MNRYKSNSIITWNDVQIAISLAVFGGLCWLVGWSITTIVLLLKNPNF